MSDREIKRPVTVANDDGIPKQFGKGAVPGGTSDTVLGRLERAGAFGDRPLTSTGGTGSLELSGVNPAVATATADSLGSTNPDETGDVSQSLDDMTKAELVEHAKAKGIAVDASKSKAEILAAIKAA